MSEAHGGGVAGHPPGYPSTMLRMVPLPTSSARREELDYRRSTLSGSPPSGFKVT
jgi:hypothetical protein